MLISVGRLLYNRLLCLQLEHVGSNMSFKNLYFPFYFVNYIYE